MSESVTSLPATRRRRAADPEEVSDYCARPMCRRQFTRLLGRGRPQTYCSDTCRRSAEKEHRQLLARLTHHEDVAAQLRADLVAFARGVDTADDNPTASPSPQVRHQAQLGIARAAGALRFLDTDDSNPAAAELRELHDSVAPAIATL